MAVERCNELGSEMEDILQIDAKRLKTMEVTVTSSTESTRLFFAAPSPTDTDPMAFFASQTGFQPTFTYPFFGQEELFRGVAEADLKICFHPTSFFAFVSFTVDEDAQSERDDILAQLTSFMAKDSWTLDWSVFLQHCQQTDVDISALGMATSLDNHYTVYQCSFENGTFKKLHERIQVLLLFYIEGSSYIDDEDLKWRVHLMFNGSSQLVGYTTLYPFLFYPDKIRMRLSQFLIFPSFHRLGLGSLLYRHVYERILADAEVKELGVEDPSPEFVVFRLANDLKIVEQDDKKQTDRASLKFSEAEYELLQQVQDLKKTGETKEFRLAVKKSLWRRNKETMPEDPKAMREAIDELYQERMELFKAVLKI